MEAFWQNCIQGLACDFVFSSASVVLAAVVTAVTAILRGAALAYFRRPKSTTSEHGPYFINGNLLTPPLTRPAYSDRMAYVLAEMSDLAYYQFESRDGMVDDAVDEALKLDLANAENVREFLDQFSLDLIGGRRLGRGFLDGILEKSGFTLLDVIQVDETQGFVCKRTVKDGPEYLVLAFRGTEKRCPTG